MEGWSVYSTLGGIVTYNAEPLEQWMRVLSHRGNHDSGNEGEDATYQREHPILPRLVHHPTMTIFSIVFYEQNTGTDHVPSEQGSHG